MSALFHTGPTRARVQSIRTILLAWALLFAGAEAVAAPAQSACGGLWTEALRAAVLHVGYYPYASLLNVRLDVSSVPGTDRLRMATLVVRRRSDGEPVHSAQLPLVEPTIRAVEKLPPLLDGFYDVSVMFATADGCDPVAGLRRSFEHRVFGWERNGLGESADVIPPFTPLTVSGKDVAAVLRNYAMNDLGLFEQIESAGTALLAGPAHFRIVVDGEERAPVAERPLRLRREGPGSVHSDAEWGAGALRASVRAAYEIDGLVRIDLELSSSVEVRIDRLDLVIPLRTDAARLMNAITDGALHHVLGAIPDGAGSVWNSLQVGRVALPPEFVPYLWLGSEERGLAWFAESPRGWFLAPGKPGQEIVRRDSSLDLVVHFATRPSVLRGTRSIHFGIQATPTKPRPEHPKPWRLWQLACRAELPVFRLCPLASGLYWGSETAYGNVYPRGGDGSILGVLAAPRRGRKADARAVESWLDKHAVDDPQQRKRARASLDYSLRALAAKPDAVAAYVNVHGAAWTPEFRVYQDEWRSIPFGDRNGADANENGEIKIRTAPSWNDYVLWYLGQMLDSGAVDGFFFDNTYLKASFDEVNGPAYRDDDGVLRPGVDLFSLRDLLKRAQTLVHQRRGAWLNVAHMSTTPIAPVQTWAGVSLGGEWKYGLDDYQDRFPRDFLRAGALGAQTGTVSAFLPGLQGSASPARRRHLERSLAGLSALHEIRVMARLEGPLETVWKALLDFGYGQPGAVVKRYWDGDRGFSLAGADAEALVVARNGRALALVVSFGESGEVELGFDAERLPAAGGVCSDLEGRGSRPETTARGCRFSLERHDFRLIAYAARGER